MDFVFHRQYRGAVKAVIFDWAGTTVDYGCMAPAGVFIDLFKHHGVAITASQAREPMGMHKKDHIRYVIQMDSVADQWNARYGRKPTEEDVEGLFSEFVPLQVECISRHADIIPGTIETMAELRRRGIRIGSTTGYNETMMAELIPAAEAAGYVPDAIVCVNEVPAGRPAPWMALESAKRLGIYPMEAVVKVGDTPVDMAEGLNAGMWTVGVVEHGNEVGVPEAELRQMPEAERRSRCQRARDRLTSAGAHYTVQSIHELPAIIDSISIRLSRGDRP